MSVTWPELCGDLPGHASEVMSAHSGLPTIQQQDKSHGAGLPVEDRGVPDDVKYAS